MILLLLALIASLSSAFHKRSLLPRLFSLKAQLNEPGLTQSVLGNLSPDILKQFTIDIESMVTNYAISTSAYYMSEFQDNDTKNWMLDFQNYGTQGFENKDWKKYLEPMIRMNPQNLTMLMTPPAGFFGTREHQGTRVVSTNYFPYSDYFYVELKY